MQSSSAGPKPAVRPARYATGLLREKSSHSAAIREAKSWKRSYSGCSMPSSRKPTGSTSETTYSRKNERDSIFKFFPARICSDLFRLCKNPLERISTTGCHLATGLAHESKYTPLRFGFISSFRTAVALGSAQIYLALPQTCTIFAAWTQRKDIFTSIPETAKARRRPRSDWPCELCAPAKAFTSDSSSSRCDTTKRKSGNSSTK